MMFSQYWLCCSWFLDDFWILILIWLNRISLLGESPAKKWGNTIMDVLKQLKSANRMLLFAIKIGYTAATIHISIFKFALTSSCREIASDLFIETENLEEENSLQALEESIDPSPFFGVHFGIHVRKSLESIVSVKSHLKLLFLLRIWLTTSNGFHCRLIIPFFLRISVSSQCTWNSSNGSFSLYFIFISQERRRQVRMLPVRVRLNYQCRHWAVTGARSLWYGIGFFMNPEQTALTVRPHRL